ncbi:Fic family protein [Leptospira brenneri]|uniref:Fic family protein n=1 Tax=Leptospira brenneri TaxID=2023182 RepID=UPI0013FDEA43|nr:Fic family protein [Leptospira brenneri]
MNFNARSYGFLTNHKESFPDYNQNDESGNGLKKIVVKYNAFNPFLLKTHYPDIKNNIKFDKDISDLNIEKIDLINIESWLLEIRAQIENSYHLNIPLIKEKSIKCIDILQQSVKLITIERNDLDLPKRIHRLLFENFPTTNILIGEFKKQQNWIDSNRALNPVIADFVPPHYSNINNLMEDWINSFNEKSEYPYIHAAILYYQFMAIHPFEDGNEKTCRILIILYFLKNQIYNKNFILLKSAIRRERERSNTILRCVSLYGSFDDWIKYFLKGLEISIKDEISVKEIDLY